MAVPRSTRSRSIDSRELSSDESTRPSRPNRSAVHDEPFQNRPLPIFSLLTFASRRSANQVAEPMTGSDSSEASDFPSPRAPFWGPTMVEARASAGSEQSSGCALFALWCARYGLRCLWCARYGLRCLWCARYGLQWFLFDLECVPRDWDQSPPRRGLGAFCFAA